MICKNCGTENIDRALFCVGCGNPLKEKPPEPAEQAPRKEKSRRGLLFFGAALAALAAVLLVCFLFFRQDSGETVAEKFVISLFCSDSEGLQQVTESHFYEYLYPRFPTEPVENCSAQAISTQSCSEEQVEKILRFYRDLDCQCEIKTPCTVEVEYTVYFGGYESTDVADVILGKIDNRWYVVDVE